VVARFLIFFTSVLVASPAAWPQEHSRAEGESQGNQHTVSTDLPVEAIPDLRHEKPTLKIPAKRARDFFIVPIPMSSPTFGSGLVLGGAYFYRQNEAQKASQPPSFTAAAAGYTDNKSWFGGVLQQNYWKEDRWRFSAVAGYLDFDLELTQSLDSPEQTTTDWLVSGSVFATAISRRIHGHWYLGLTARYLDITQSLGLVSDQPDYNLDPEIKSPGIGLTLQYDTRDKPTNAYTGKLFELKSVFADQQDRPRGEYQSYSAELRSYHRLRDDLVLAWEVNGCAKNGTIPLWDTCRLNLRGFPVTEYLGTQSFSGQAEARWHFSPRWGAVAFAGAGWVDQPFSDNGRSDTIPSYGLGIRFMVLESQRINMRLDYGRSSDGSGAIYLAVGEAF